METITFHVCPNDCVVFRNDCADNVSCPVCNSCRYKPNSTVPQRKFVYMPIGPRLERLYSTKNISELLQSYKNISSDKMNDIQDSPCWKALFGVDGPFGGDKRGLALSLCVDGVNPFSVQRVSYSMWPIMITVLNLPRPIRTCFLILSSLELYHQTARANQKK